MQDAKNIIKINENISSYMDINRDFYTNLEKLIENNYAEEYINYKIGLIDFQTMIKKVKNNLDRNTRFKYPEIESKIKYLMNNNYIIHN